MFVDVLPLLERLQHGIEMVERKAVAVATVLAPQDGGLLCPHVPLQAKARKGSFFRGLSRRYYCCVPGKTGIYMPV